MNDYGDYLDLGAYDSAVTTDDQTHVTGNQNSGGGGSRSLSVNAYQWVIVVGAVAALWVLYFGFRSDIKVG